MEILETGLVVFAGLYTMYQISNLYNQAGIELEKYSQPEKIIRRTIELQTMTFNKVTQIIRGTRSGMDFGTGNGTAVRDKV